MAVQDDLRIVRRLSQYRPFEGGGASAREAQQDLVLGAMAEADWSCDSISACTDSIETLFRVRFDELETAEALRLLVQDGRVTSRPGGGFVVSGDEQLRMNEAVEQSEAVSEAALAEWREYLLGQWPGLLSEHVERLEADLGLFLENVIARHGAEAT